MIIYYDYDLATQTLSLPQQHLAEPATAHAAPAAPSPAEALEELKLKQMQELQQLQLMHQKQGGARQQSVRNSVQSWVLVPKCQLTR